ncbi:MAG TPA: hypothetical protein VGC76_19270 [Pyrinomonadaceae bacterium]|jgi:hypothetical protein
MAETDDNRLTSETQDNLPETEEFGEIFDRAGTAAVGTSVDNNDTVIEDFDEKDSSLKWLLPLIILVVFIILGFWFCGKSAAPKQQAANIDINLFAELRV